MTLPEDLLIAGTNKEKDMAFFEWQQSMSVGVDRFDDEHKQLVGFLNDLNHALTVHSTQKTMEDILNRLVIAPMECIGRSSTDWGYINGTIACTVTGHIGNMGLVLWQ